MRRLQGKEFLMAQDLLEISAESFDLQLPFMSTMALKDLHRRIYEDFKWRFLDKIPEPVMLDLERKESMIIRELQRRGFYKPKHNPQEKEDYFRWRASFNKRKRYW